MNGATMSIMGLYEYDETLFDLMEFPAGFEMPLTDVANYICMECGELEVLYPNATVMKNLIGIWSMAEQPTWARFLAAANAEYDPIENYDRRETFSRERNASTVHSGSDSAELSNTSTNSGTDSNMHKFASYDSETMKEQTNDLYVHGKRTVDAGESTTTYGHVIGDQAEETETNRIHGNIGVTTSQQMLTQELEILPKLNFLKHIADSFKKRFCILVY